MRFALSGSDEKGPVGRDERVDVRRVAPYGGPGFAVGVGFLRAASVPRHLEGAGNDHLHPHERDDRRGLLALAFRVAFDADRAAAVDGVVREKRRFPNGQRDGPRALLHGGAHRLRRDPFGFHRRDRAIFARVFPVEE